MTEQFKISDGASRQAALAVELHGAIGHDDWREVFPPGSGATEPTQSQLHFDQSIYSDPNAPLTNIAQKLEGDVNALSQSGKGTSQYDRALADLTADEGTLRKDVFSLKDESPNFLSFETEMDGYHSELKGIATDLWNMGLKNEASETTAYYPLSNYEHDFQNSGSDGSTSNPAAPGSAPPSDSSSGGAGNTTPPEVPSTPSTPDSPSTPSTPDSPSAPATPDSPGTQPDIPGAQVFNNLQDSTSWKNNTDAAEIGGSGDVQGMSITPGQTMTYTSQMGAYGDTLGSVAENVSSSDSTFQLNYGLDPSSATFKNTQCIEDDMVITTANGQQAVAGSQFNLSEKAPDGMCWFQTWNTTSGSWENAALVPIPKEGEVNDVSMTVAINSNGTYTYSPLSYDGQTYDLQNNTFSMKSSNWTRNEVIVQVQEDANANGGPISEQYTNMQLQAG